MSLRLIWVLQLFSLLSEFFFCFHRFRVFYFKNAYIWDKCRVYHKQHWPWDLGKKTFAKFHQVLIGQSSMNIFIFIYLFLKIYLFSLEKGEGREKERERNTNVWLPLLRPPLRTWPTTQARALTRNWTSDPLVHGPALNPPSHTSQGSMNIFKCPILNFQYLPLNWLFWSLT